MMWWLFDDAQFRNKMKLLADALKKGYIIDPYPHRQKANQSLAEKVKQLRGKQQF